MNSSTASRCRIGHGYDLHRLEPLAPAGAGRPLILGGMPLGGDVGPVGHSDGDVLFHAVTDALLGSVGHADIGQLFPDTDPRHDGADSEIFLRAAVDVLQDAGYGLINLDATVICERPRIGPIKERLIDNLARVLLCDRSRINVKGKTHEGVDAVGEGRAIEVHCVVLVERA